MFHRIGSAMAVALLAVLGLTVTAGPSEAAKWYGGRYNRVVNCYGAIGASNDLMNRGGHCHWDGSHFTIYTREKRDKYIANVGGFNRIGTCYKRIKSDAWLMSQSAACGWYWDSYVIDLMRGPYNG